MLTFHYSQMHCTYGLFGKGFLITGIFLSKLPCWPFISSGLLGLLKSRATLQPVLELTVENYVKSVLWVCRTVRDAVYLSLSQGRNICLPEGVASVP